MVSGDGGRGIHVLSEEGVCGSKKKGFEDFHKVENYPRECVRQASHLV